MKLLELRVAMSVAALETGIAEASNILSVAVGADPEMNSENGPQRCLTHIATGAVDLYSIQLQSSSESYGAAYPRAVKKHT